MVDVTQIEKRVDRAIAAPIPVDEEVGGFDIKTLGEVMEFAKLMAISGAAIPGYLRNNPGGCLAICSRAIRWQMDPFAVAEKSYMVRNRGEDRIAFESQLIHAVVISRAPLKGRLRHEIVGEGDERRCRVWATFKSESEPHLYESETLGRLREARGRNEQGQLKGSPLWETQPEVQLAYSAVRQWARLFSPDTLLGVYTPDELDVEPGPTPIASLGDRLRAAKQASVAGFDMSHVARESGAIIEGEATREDVYEQATARSDGDAVAEGRQDDAGHRGDDHRDETGSGGAGGPDQPAGSVAAGQASETAQAAEGGPAGDATSAKPKAKRR